MAYGSDKVEKPKQWLKNIDKLELRGLLAPLF